MLDKTSTDQSDLRNMHVQQQSAQKHDAAVTANQCLPSVRLAAQSSPQQAKQAD